MGNVGVHDLGLLVDLLHDRLLLHDERIHVFEQLSEFDDLAFNLLDGFVAALDGAEGGLGLAAAVGLEELYVEVSSAYASSGG